MGWRESKGSSQSAAVPELLAGQLCSYLVMSLEYLSKKEKDSEATRAGCLFIPATTWHTNSKAGFIPCVGRFIAPATLCHVNTAHRNGFP